MGGAELAPLPLLRAVAVLGTAAAVMLYMTNLPPPAAGAPPHVFSGVQQLLSRVRLSADPPPPAAASPPPPDASGRGERRPPPPPPPPA
ncbi:hypothetical protein BU14_0033s0018 [Porphyra umbilicalis]|uniref:Uncharacterized protein n=1 Tax=Porphyra umbilicalis TaxID=2786 RepID=A0A1X6PIG6_PORUM|nr:hypothetical protein BU14_0033s0018 [Porphyra umbilicalis]|eukprot:OSX80674.1 hypothetical protein BU14_0033s0018 [Porphyra umbilicalis]